MNRRAAQALVVVGLVICATGLTAVARLVANETMFIFFIAAVAGSTRFGGWPSGAAAATLSVLAVDYLFNEPVGSWQLTSPDSVARLVSFALVACLIIILTDALRRAQQRSADLARRADRARRAAEEATAEAERVSAARGRFLATMSHEVRTPVNALLGYADLLEIGVGGSLTAEQAEYIGRLRTAGRHLLSVVNDVLDIAKVDAGRLTVTTQTEAIDDAVRASTALVLPQAARKAIDITSTPCDASLSYRGDPGRVRQILVNLLSNAIKFTPDQGRVTIAWGSWMSPARPATPPDGGDARVWISVHDTGPGIAPEHQDRVFEPFEQVGSGGQAGQSGTGLGLAISRRLARRMGGELLVGRDSAPGSTFTLWLPSTPSESVNAKP